jgi:hypothetical protein
MNKKMQQIADKSMETITSMEKRLSGVLKPVKPSKEFVHGVAERIQMGNQASLVERIANWNLLAMLIAGLISLAVFLAVVGGVLVSLLGKKRTA